MRNLMKLISITMLFVLLLSGCGTTLNEPGTKDAPKEGGLPSNTIEELYTFRAEVIEGGTTLLITPSEESNEARSSDKMSVSLNGATIVNEVGESITAEDLQAGDILMITYNGMIAESYPAQIGATKIEKVDHNNLLDGYFALIDDIYQEDDGLNSDIDTIALDTSEWINLTDIEKEMLFAKVKEAYGFEVLEGTYDELAEQGLIDKENLSFPKGVLIKISEMTYDENKEVINCSISKWRSGLGAIGADDVSAELKDGTWKITKEGNWIS
ncbi:MAG: hypothetical protein K0R46_1153 [Herbinix sp.]|nr:hypothetical protein [Herbinix sp.]